RPSASNAWPAVVPAATARSVPARVIRSSGTADTVSPRKSSRQLSTGPEGPAAGSSRRSDASGLRLRAPHRRPGGASADLAGRSSSRPHRRGREQVRIVIVGAGIAGLTLAVALRRHGIVPVVLEQSHRPVPPGTGIQVPPSVVHRLRALG